MRWRRWLVRATIGLGGLVLVGLIIVQTPAFHRWALRVIVEQLSRYVDGRVHVDGLGGNLFSGARLTGVTITRNGEELVHADTIAIGYHALGFAVHQVAISDLTIDGLRVRAVQDRSGWNLATLLKPQPASTGRPWPVSLRHFALRNGNALITREAGAPMNVLFNADGWAWLDAGAVHASIDHLTLTDRTSGLAVDSASAGLVSTNGALQFVARLAAHGATVNARGQFDPARQAGQAFTEVRSLDVSRLPAALGLPALSTAVAADVDLSLDADRWSAEARLDESRVARATIERGALARANSEGRSVRYQVRGGVRHLDLSQFRSWLGPSAAVASDFNGRVDAQGLGLDPRAGTLATRLHLSSSRVAGAEIARLDGTLHLDRGRARASVDADFANVSETAIPEAGRPLTLNGHAVITADVPDVNAPRLLPTISGDVRSELRRSSVNGVAIDAAVVDASVAHGLATVRRLNVSSPGVNATANGTVAFGDHGSSRLQFTADLLDASRFNALAGADLAGAGHIEGTLTGTSASPRATGTIKAFSLAYGTTASALTLNTTFDATAPHFDPQALDVSGKAEGTFIKVSDSDLDRVAATVRYRHGAFDVNGTVDQHARTVTLDGSLQTTAGGQRLLLRKLGVSTNGVAWTTAPGQVATVVIDDAGVSVDHLELINAQQKIVAEGSLGRHAPSGRPLTVHGTAVDLSDVARVMLSARPIDGRLDFDATVGGTFDAPRGASHVTITNARSGATTIERVAGDVEIGPPDIRVKLFVEQNPSATLQAEGTVPSALAFGPDAGRPYDLRLKSDDISLGIVEAMTTELTAVTGTATLDLHVGGPAQSPDVTGRVDVTGAGFKVVATGVTYVNSTAALTIASNRLQVDALRLQDHDGHALTAKGTADIFAGAGGSRAFSLELTSDDVHVLNNELGNVRVTGSLRAAEDGQGAILDGRLRVTEGRLELDRLLARLADNAYSTERKKTAGEQEAQAAAAADQPSAPSFYDGARFNIALELPDNVVIRGRDLRTGSSTMALGDVNVTLGGRLQIQKAVSGEPTVAGELTAVRGFYEFQGRRFDVERGSWVRFNGDSTINPRINISATRVISAVTARVNVTGTVARPTIALSSTPPLDQGDILSLIVFNQPMNELGTAEKVSLGQRAGALAAGAIASPIADSVARALDLDLVEITAPEANGQGAGLTLGRQLSDRIYLNFKQNFGRGDISTLSFEYRFNDALRLVTSVAQTSQSSRRSQANQLTGIDFVYFIRY